MGRYELPSDEFRQLVIRAQSGDADALNLAAHEHIALIRYCIKKYKLCVGGWISYGEAYSEGWDGLVDAVSRFDVNGPHKFSTYAAFRICGSIRDANRREARRQARNGRLAESLVYAEMSGPEPSLDSPADRQRLDAVLAKWKADDSRKVYADVFEILFGIDPRGPLSYQEIGRILGMSRHAVWQAARRGFRLLCGEFGVRPGDVHARILRKHVLGLRLKKCS